MAIAHNFEYYRPTSLKDALRLLNEYREKASLLAGGTDLTVYIKEGLARPAVVIDIKQVQELKKCEISPEGLFIGANTTFSDILETPEIKQDYLLLWEAARSVASIGIRNRATLVGNICSAVPSLDSAPALLCYEAKIHLIGKGSERDVSINDWFLAPRKTARQADEIVAGVSIPKPVGKNAGIYLKLGRYGGEDLAQAGLGLLINYDNDPKVAFCAVGPIPRRAFQIESLLRGKSLTADLVNQAKALVSDEICPITDIRASQEYRIHMCRVMLGRGLQACVDRLDGKQVDNLRILGG